MKIRKATNKDSIKIKKLIEGVLDEIFGRKPRDWLKEINNLEKTYVVFYIAEDKGEILGCIALKKGKIKAELKRMYIKKGYRRKGIGQKLFDIFLKFCLKNDYKKIILSTHKKMKGAIRFYKKNKFVKIKHNKEYVFLERKL